MKAQIKILLTVVILAIAMLANGQSTLLSDTFEKYSGKEGIEEVLMTNKMIAMMMSKQSKDENPVAKNLSNNLKEIRVLSNKSGIPFSPSLQDIRKDLEKNNYQKLMQVTDNKESVTIYMLENKDGNIADFVMVSKDNKEEVLLSILGNLTMEEVFMASAYINLNLERMMNIR